MTHSDRVESERQFEQMRNSFLLRATIEEAHFHAAQRFASDHHTGLRGGDALHVAIAHGYGLSVATMDRTMAKGARQLGVDTVLLPEASDQ